MYDKCKDFELVTVTDKGGGHFQIQGKYLVNHYPKSKNKTAYIEKTTQGIKYVSCCRAIQLALKPDTSGIKIVKRKKGGYFLIKKEMYVKSNICGLCGKPIKTFKEATLDHIIPLSKGGLDERNNWQLAHEFCNKLKGNKL